MIVSEQTAAMTAEEREKLQAVVAAMTEEERKEYRNAQDPDSMGFYGEEGAVEETEAAETTAKEGGKEDGSK